MSADANDVDTANVPTDDRAERCEACRYWREYPARGDDAGECQRYPPVIIGSLLADTGDSLPLRDEYDASRFPMTGPDEWCGEWQAKTKGKAIRPTDAPALVEGIDPAVIGEQLDELNRQSRALRILFRSARARQRKR